MALHYQTITQVAALLESRQISPVELTEEMLQRIGQLDGRLKSYATLLPEQARAAARSAEEEISAGAYRGPLHGIPIAVKDLCCTRGVRTMGGTRVLADYVPDFDATVVARLAAAGAVLLGKLNLTEGAMGGYHPDFEIPLNPWDARRWTGSSSSGSGVATAAGLCFGSLGSDTGGSIRFPAAACGTVGLKPTWGRVSRYGVLDLAATLDHVGPLTRSAADAGIVLQAIAGFDPNDPTSLPDPVGAMGAAIDRGVKGLRVGLDEEYARKDIDPEITAAVLAGVKVLEDLGAEIVPVKLPDMDPYVAAWFVLCAAEAVVAHGATYPSRRHDYGPWLQGILDKGAQVTGADYARANHLRAACCGRLRCVFEPLDLLVCPTTAMPPHPVRPEQLYGSMPPDRPPSFQRFTVPFDFNGAPTLSLPCGRSSAGLPLSIQFVGKHLSEPLLCRVGHAYEQATPWQALHPPV